MSQIVTHQTDNLDLASSLLAMGVAPWPPNSPNWIQEVQDPLTGPRVICHFGQATLDGKTDTGRLLRAWNDPEFIRRHPEHPFAYLKAAFRHRSALQRLIKSRAPFLIVREGNALAAIPATATAVQQDKILARAGL